MRIDFTLLADGESDRALVRVATWLFEQHVPGNMPVRGEAADLSRLPHPPKGLAQRIHRAFGLYPCNVLLVHRDAEAQEATRRFEEIETAWREARIQPGVLYVSVVPMRMTEAWLLFDEVAIRRASDNPNGTIPLNLPRLGRVESEPNPKQVLFEALQAASGLQGRHLKQFRPYRCRRILANLIDDFAPLRQLSAFRRFEDDVRDVVERMRSPEA